MQKPTFDPGLTQRFAGPLRRIINKDGSFNVHRIGTTWRDFHPYLHLINMSWLGFLASLFVGYLAVNTVFAVLYFWLPAGELQGAEARDTLHRFLNGFFFSGHTLTTVGYGNISPAGLAANDNHTLVAPSGDGFVVNLSPAMRAGAERSATRLRIPCGEVVFDISAAAQPPLVPRSWLHAGVGDQVGHLADQLGHRLGRRRARGSPAVRGACS